MLYSAKCELLFHVINCNFAVEMCKRLCVRILPTKNMIKYRMRNARMRNMAGNGASAVLSTCISCPRACTYDAAAKANDEWPHWQEWSMLRAYSSTIRCFTDALPLACKLFITSNAVNWMLLTCCNFSPFALMLTRKMLVKSILERDFLSNWRAMKDL